MSDLQKIYAARFEETGIEKRKRVWQVLCADFFSKFIPPQSAVLDLACGYGEFINNIKAREKFAIDLNPQSPSHLDAGIKFFAVPANDLGFAPSDSIDVVFTSNFLEHLPDKATCSAVMQEVRRVLRPGGRFIVLGPNIRFAHREYWDYYDHYLALSDRSLVEGLTLNGFSSETVIPQFLPYTMNNKTPTADALIRLYLKLPLAWKVFGKQFLVVARKA